MDTQVSHEVGREIVAFAIKAEHLTEDIIKAAMREGLSLKNYGKQSIESLTKDGCTLQNIEISDSNIKSFEQVSRKYKLSYSVKRDSSDKSMYFVFFKGKDLKTMEEAFAEYTSKALAKDSVKEKIKEKSHEQLQDKNRERAKHKDKGMDI